MFDIVNSQIIVARETDQVVLIALMIAHEDVLTMHTPIIFPPAFGFLDSLAFGVVVGRERNAILLQIAQHFLLPLGYNLVVSHMQSFTIITKPPESRLLASDRNRSV